MQKVVTIFIAALRDVICRKQKKINTAYRQLNKFFGGTLIQRGELLFDFTEVSSSGDAHTEASRDIDTLGVRQAAPSSQRRRVKVRAKPRLPIPQASLQGRNESEL